jgi:hypothetical protein
MDHDGISQTVDWIHVSCTYVARDLVLADLALSLISWNVDGICSAGKNWYEFAVVRVDDGTSLQIFLRVN